MRKLEVPKRLKQEFATVGALWGSDGETRRVDSLLLSWIKYEKQLRRPFCFFVFQHLEVSEVSIGNVISILADSRELYP